MKFTRQVLILGLTLSIFSCKKNSNEPDPTNTDPFQLPYNKESVENNKAFIETEGRSFIQKINSLPDQKGIDVLEVLADLNAPEVNFEQRQMLNIGRKAQKAGAVLNAMSKISKPSARKKSPNELYGIFTYDRINDNWIESESTDRLSFIFPSTKGGTNNDANLTLTYKSSGIEMKPEDDEDSYELPSEISGTLKVGAETVLTLLSTHTYYSDGLPKTADTKIVLGEYSFTNILKKEDAASEAVMSISKGDSKLIEWTTSTKNKNFDFEQLNNAEEINDILSSASSIITIGNIKVVTWADIDQFVANDKEVEYPDWNTYFENVNWDNAQQVDNAYQQYYAAEDAAEKEDAENEKELYQKYSKAVVIKTTTNEVICSIDYIVKEEEGYCWTPGTTEVCNTDTYVDPLLVFGDGSKIDFNTFGDTGFEDLKTDYENFVDRF